MYVLDSNTISYYFRNEACVVSALREIPLNQIAVPAIVIYELQYGLRRLPDDAATPRLRALDKFIKFMRIIDVDRSVAECAARIRSQLETQGTPIGAHDILIAASALSIQGQLVTRNVREFQRVQGLQVVNWFDIEK